MIISWIESHLALLWLLSAGLLAILLVWVAVMQIRVSRLLGRYLSLMRGQDGAHLEDILESYLEQASATAQQVQELDKASKQLQKAAKNTLQHIGIVRYDAFPDMGGEQSFSIAIVDGHGTGVVISSLAGRQIQRTYAKPLKRWESEHTLTDEEKEAIAHAYRQGV